MVAKYAIAMKEEGKYVSHVFDGTTGAPRSTAARSMHDLSLFGEIVKFSGELVHGAKRSHEASSHRALAFIKRPVQTITNIVGGCDRCAIEGGIGGGIIFAPFVGPGTIPIGAIGGGAGGCIIGGFEGALGV